MILKAILCVQHFCCFGAMLLIVNLLTKTDSTITGFPCILENVCYEPFCLTLVYMGYFDYLFYMGGGAKSPPV